MPARGTRPVASPANRRDLRGLPAQVLTVGSVVHRIHPEGGSPSWFNRDGSRRFDLSGRYGTCYTAATEEGAFIEVFGRTGIIDPDDIASRLLAVITLEVDVRLADITASSALGFGISNVVSAGIPYDVHSQPWARAIFRAGFDGIRYLLRHDTTGDEVGYALFGSGGATPGPGSSTSAPITAGLLFRCIERWDLQLPR